ncbi:BTB/POZ domain-containing protein [Lachnellula hyalina]|uniref:BTB/POZ domain-containing protein n=1 Tax=Lachnellula hyalina TaxID=1316788 RepID=A0A8H8R331_9HELO|nr:BTB/POZ domain-containing protein [Lachnellula hyalina]TVY27543.1 BTB/POZ domain-containing protein [Lachnellula hyalina]
MNYPLLWKYFYNDEIERFRKLLANANHNTQHASKGYGGGPGAHSWGSIVGSPGASPFSTSPRAFKNRKVSGQAGNFGGKGGNSIGISRSDVNSKDHAGVPLLCRIVSSKLENAVDFALALIEHPLIDLYAQDTENGWTALHRALYTGNVTLARVIIEKDSHNLQDTSAQRGPTSVIKVKDHEGNSPFDVYNATIARRAAQRRGDGESDEDSEENSEPEDAESGEGGQIYSVIDGDEVFAWGSSKNYNLGFGDQDDRQYPEKITLKRPDHLLFRFYREYLESIQSTDDAMYQTLSKSNPKSVSELPSLISNRPIVVQDVALSKLHSAILTNDPECNLFMCGFGPGGRLGTGDEVTRFSYVCIENGLSGKHIIQVALGNNHSLAVDSNGEIFSWGQNTHGVLGYSLPRPALTDEDPICSTPRQIFGPLKREHIIGVAASAIHSVAHTATSLFTFGKNEGQLGLMDSDSRSLEVQPIPRKVAASLFKAPIKMVSAINQATIVLLENHTVCVFTNYGYNIIKFPSNDGFSNYHLKSNAFTSRSDSLSDNITNITAAGDTIAAFSTQNLFTINVRKIDSNSATSTTNPAKIKDSLTTPQRVWSLRKGHWDGIKSASVTENGSVVVCTQAGAVWQRIKRTKVKDAFAGTGTFHRKDFKFQRVPGLTKVAAVRSTAFGVYAAIRKDCDVTKTQIEVAGQTLWDDVNPLLSIRDLEASEVSKEDHSPRFWTPSLREDLIDPLKWAVLTSLDLEADIGRHLSNVQGDYDAEIGTTTSDVRIPVHSFMIARSSILRTIIGEFRQKGRANIADVLDLEGGHHGRTTVIFQSLDFITLINLVLYLYTDTVIDVWHFTRNSPNMAFRYRQIRVELMKVAAHLKLSKLESAVRLMTEPKPCMNLDMALAIQDPSFFDDYDTIIELDGSEMAAHSALLCQRCPFFEGLFNGRAGGQWLDGRREEGSKAVRIDLKHISPSTFELVLRYLYADAGPELFDDVVSADIDEFSDLVMDVMAASNELMLDRLSQICQQTIGRFVSTRNVCYLVNAIAPCSITEFKDAALEYVCLQLESMLENHLMNDLDEDLVYELDEIVRANQLACLPFAKSERAELLLHARHPSLAGDIDEERQRRLRDMAFRANLRDDDNRQSSSFRARLGSPDDFMSVSPSQEKLRRTSKGLRNEPFSPIIRPKDSTVDLMFDMDDDEPLGSRNLPSRVPDPVQGSTAKAGDVSPGNKEPWAGQDPRSIPDEEVFTLPSNLSSVGTPKTPEMAAQILNKWPSPALPSSKLNMREIMAQASSGRTSSLSMSLSVQKTKDAASNDDVNSRVDTSSKTAPSKISQKERKKQQQQALQQAMSSPQINVEQAGEKASSPWQIAATGPKTSLKDVLKEPTSSLGLTPKSAESPISSRPLTVRRTASPDTRFSGQQRSNSAREFTKEHRSSPAGSSRATSGSKSGKVSPHSKSYIPPVSRAEPSLQLSMSDIIGQQRREQEVIKEAVAKRSLQEIQEEQAFQEWWDQESRKAREEEAVRARVSAPGAARGGKSGGGRGKGGNRGRGARGRGDASSRGRGRGKAQEKNTGATQ